MIEHTAGPWSVVDDPEDYHSSGATLLLGPDRERIAELLSLNYSDDRLLAAAPDLLAACRAAATLLWAMRVGPENPVLKDLEAAIAKSTGEGV